jgi:8-amino-7-oxononanoate synthase
VRAVSLDDEARAELAELEAAHRLRQPRLLTGRQGPRIVIDGARVTNFASNDYLGLAGDPRLARAAATALDEHGLGAGASRLLAGNHRGHVELEQAVQDWMRCGGVRLFNTGYAANVGVLTALLRPEDVVFSDELDHASIIDGCRLSRATIHVYPHRDLGALERALRDHSGRRRLVVSESVFSMDGDVADVAALADLCRRHEAALMLDEAHAVGVLGPEGRGVAAQAGIVPDLVVGTFGKALGTFGAFVATTRAIADLLWNRARPLVFSTAMPSSIAYASKVAIELVRGSDGSDRRRQLQRQITRLRNGVPELLGDPSVPIAPWIVGDDAPTLELGRSLLATGLLVAAVRPPTVAPGTARLRISLGAVHGSEEIDQLISALQSKKSAVKTRE